MSLTIFDKIWENHYVQNDLIYIDLHLIHEVTSPQAFEGLRLHGRKVRRPDKSLATVDHNVPTDHPKTVEDIKNLLSRKQVEKLEANCKEAGIPLFSVDSDKRGIVHMIGPELGLTQPGMTIVCGDSHTSTHGAFGALAFGIGTSEVEHVLATQTLLSKKLKQMRIHYTNPERRHPDTTAKDYILYTIGKLGASGMSGYLVEYAGEGIEALSMEERMTICNMSIEGGAKAGIVSPDNKTINWFKQTPQGKISKEKQAEWLAFRTDKTAEFDKEIVIDIADIKPQITWGTTPAMVESFDKGVPEPRDASEGRALAYMGLIPGQKFSEIQIDEVFLGSCTNSRISDLRLAAFEIKEILKNNPNQKVAVKSRVVPGSELVRRLAETEGIDKIFKQVGFEWASAGCSSCLGMMDSLGKVRVASTSNRNFEGRQGKGTQTHLLSPRMLARAAMKGTLA